MSHQIKQQLSCGILELTQTQSSIVLGQSAKQLRKPNQAMFLKYPFLKSQINVMHPNFVHRKLKSWLLIWLVTLFTLSLHPYDSSMYL